MNFPTFAVLSLTFSEFLKSDLLFAYVIFITYPYVSRDALDLLLTKISKLRQLALSVGRRLIFGIRLKTWH